MKLKHIVMWKLKAEAEGKTKTENAQWMKTHLESLVGVVPGLLSCSVGINCLDDSNAFDAVLLTEFENAEALAAYKIHPAHVAISTYCKKIRESRVVVDYME